jgi:hypothetical protein
MDCLACSARLDTATPYPQLCSACRATGTALALRRIEAECDALASAWGAKVSALPPLGQERFEAMLVAWRDAADLPATFHAQRERIVLFKRRLNATLKQSDDFAQAVAAWWQCMERRADRDTLRMHVAFTERDGQGAMDL